MNGRTAPHPSALTLRESGDPAIHRREAQSPERRIRTTVGTGEWEDDPRGPMRDGKVYFSLHHRCLRS